MNSLGDVAARLDDEKLAELTKMALRACEKQLRTILLSNDDSYETLSINDATQLCSWALDELKKGNAEESGHTKTVRFLMDLVRDPDRAVISLATYVITRGNTLQTQKRAAESALHEATGKEDGTYESAEKQHAEIEDAPAKVEAFKDKADMLLKIIANYLGSKLKELFIREYNITKDDASVLLKRLLDNSRTLLTSVVDAVTMIETPATVPSYLVKMLKLKEFSSSIDFDQEAAGGGGGSTKEISEVSDIVTKTLKGTVLSRLEKLLATRLDSDAFVPPLSYKQLFASPQEKSAQQQQSSSNQSVWVWEPQPPPGYVALVSTQESASCVMYV